MSAVLPRAIAAEHVVLRTPAIAVALAEVRVAADHVVVSVACRGHDAGVDLVEVTVLADGERFGLPHRDELQELGPVGVGHAGRVAAALGHPVAWGGGGTEIPGTSVAHVDVAPIPAEGDLTLVLTVRGRGLEAQVALDGDELRHAAANQIAPWG